MSDKRLNSSLSRAGVNLDEIEGMDRNTMIDRWAKLLVAGGDKAATADSGVTAGKAVTAGYDIEFEHSKLAFEREKFAAEKAERERIHELEKTERERLAHIE